MTFTDVFNFRDLGGLPTADDRAVRPGLLFRSDGLYRLTDDDWPLFLRYGIRTVVDLRTPEEVERDGRVREADGLEYRHVPVKHTAWTERPYDPAAGAARYLADRYLDFTEEGVEGLRDALLLVADSGAAPLAVHCFAGKDRTGTLVALTLALLGVPDDVVAADYARTAETMPLLEAWVRRRYPKAKPIPHPWDASPPEAMTLFLADLRERHGSVTAYAGSIGVPAAAVADMRQHLLT